MNAHRTPVRRVGVGLAVAAALATSACGAGQVAATSQVKTTLDGTNVQIGNIALRGLAIKSPTASTFPVGSNLVLNVVIVNDGNSADTLTRISSTSAASWGSFASSDDLTSATSLAPGAAASGSAAAPTDTTPSGTAPSDTSSAGTLPSAGPDPSTLSAAARKGIAVGRGLAVSYGVPVAGSKVLALTGTKSALYPGNTVRVTFTFAKAGSRTFTVPIQLTQGGSYTVPPKVLSSSPSDG